MKNTILTLSLIILCSNQFFAQSAPEYDTLSIGNIRQVVSYSGSKDAPLILFLHGGPGSSRMKQAPQFTNLLEKNFLVVQWDQRETARTLALNKSDVPITLELMENDTYELIRILLTKFNQQKLYLVGESWGTVLGFKMAGKHPDLLHAYLAFSPVINQSKSEELLLEELKRDAKEKQNSLALTELNRIRIPFENYQQLYYSRKWMFNYDGTPFADKDTATVKQYLQNWSETWLPTWNQAIRQNGFTDLPQISCPVYFFIGEKDLQTNAGIAKEYFALLKAPRKDIFLFKDAGHSVLTEKSEEVQKLILELRTTSKRK
ncbi:haloalkane dehalogenase [compost metagenome]